MGVKEACPKNLFQFCIDGICNHGNDTNSLPEYQKPVFLTFRKFRFSLGSRPSAPYFIVHQKAINAKFACHHFNKPIKNGRPQMVHIQCSKYFVRLLFFEGPKDSLAPSLSLFFFFSLRQLIPDNVRFSAYGNSKRVAVIFHFFLHPFSLSLFFLSFFFWGGGRGEEVYLGIQGGPTPNNFQ